MPWNLRICQPLIGLDFPLSLRPPHITPFKYGSFLQTCVPRCENIANMSSIPLSHHSKEITRIHLTDSEISSRQINSHNLQRAIEALHQDGVVVVENAIPPSYLDQLNALMTPDAHTLYERRSTHRNFGPETGNIQQEVPVQKAIVRFREQIPDNGSEKAQKQNPLSMIIANPFATAIIECMLGPRPQLRFLSANTAFRTKEAGRQPPHIDVAFDFPRVPFGFCVNVNLIDTAATNGATELWPGTHTGTDVSVLTPNNDGVIREELVEARRKLCPPVQPVLPKGSIIIRDFRLWHAGMPNWTDEPRVMLVTVLFARWYRSELKMRLPESCRDEIEWGDLESFVDWMGEDYDYVQGAHDHDFVLLP